MMEAWLSRQIASIEYTRMKYFKMSSQANHLAKLIDLKEEFRKERMEDAIQVALEKADSKNIKALRALIDFDSVNFDEGKLTGLSEQIEKLKEECDFLFFEEEEEKPKFTKGIAPFENKADLSGLSYKERLKLYREMPEIYKRLAK